MLKVKDNIKLEDLKKFGFSNNWAHTRTNYCADFWNMFIEIDAETRIITATMDSDYESVIKIHDSTLEELYHFFNSGVLEVVKDN